MKPVVFSLDNKILKYWRFWAVFLLFLIFFFLRLYRLGFHDLWYDEITTISYARYFRNNWNAPLYWLLMHFWIKACGISEFSLRFPSLIFSFLSVILVFNLGKEFFNKRVGIVASILIGLSPFHLWYAQEARDYSMVLFFATLSSYLLFKATKEKGFKLWLLFVLVSIMGIYTSYFYLLLFLAHGIYIIFNSQFKLRFKEIICFLIVMLAFLLHLPKFFSKFYFLSQGFWIFKPTWKSLIITLENFILGYNGTSVLYLISDILAGIFLISAVWCMRKKELREKILFCIFLCFVPIIAAFIFSKVFFSIYLDRGLIIFSPYYYIILSLGIVSLFRKLKIPLLALFIFIVLIAVYGYFKDQMVMPLEHHLGTYIKKPIKPITKFLTNAVEPKDDIVAFTNVSTVPSIYFYSKEKLSSFYFLFDPQFPDTNWQRPIQENKYNVPFYKINLLRFKRLWVISSDWARSGELDEHSRSVKDWLDKNLKLEFAKEFDGLWLYRYVKKF